MRISISFISLWFCLSYVQASEDINLPLDSGEEVTVKVYPATFSEPKKPILIWFTEGYSSRKPFKKLISEFNDLGYEFWQVDLLDSYFLERTPTNVRRLSGEGVAAVLEYATKQTNKTGKFFVPISTGRMSLILLRGSRLWQLNEHPNHGVGNLKQVVTFFPNFFDAPKKAGDAPRLFPIVASTSLPITLVQPSEGTYKWKLPHIIKALESGNSQVTVASAANSRDWYFLRRDPSDLEKQEGEKISERFETWLKAGQVSAAQNFKPAVNLQTTTATMSVKGLVPIDKRIAPNFELSDVQGNKIHLKDKRGKVVLLNFWASWCPPCVKEIPSMNRLAKKFKVDDFEIVSVNFKETPETIKAFLKNAQVDFPVLIDLDGKVSNQYEIFAFPSSFIIDAQGRLRYSVNSAIEWDKSQVKQVLNTLIKK